MQGQAAEINLSLLKTVAFKLRSLNEDVMFLGGAVLPLLVTGPAVSDIRKAKDVDLMVHAPSKPELCALEDRFWEAGLKRMRTSAVCRWLVDNIPIDVLTTEKHSVGFINNWGVETMSGAQHWDLDDALRIKIIRSTHYLAVKFDAFYRRGDDNYETSTDIYDILLLLRGCPDTERDFQLWTSRELQSHLVGELTKLLDFGARWERKAASESRSAGFGRQWRPETVERMRRIVSGSVHSL